MIYFCNIGGSLNDTLHIDVLPTVGAANYDAFCPQDIKRIIAHTKAAHVRFGQPGFPARGVSADSPKLDGLLNKLFRPAPPPKLAARPVNADNSDLDGIIDN